MRHLRVAAVLFLSAVPAFAADAPVPLKAVNELTLLVKADGAPVSDTLWLVNGTKTALPVTLSFGPISIDSTHQIVPAAVHVVKPPTTIPTGNALPITITADNFWPGAGASATLRNQGAAVTTIHFAALPFGVTPEGWKEATPFPLKLRRGEGGRFTLLNPDSVAHDIRYSLSTPGATPIVRDLVLQPESPTIINVPFEASWFPDEKWWESLIREPSGDATLAVSAIVPPANGTTPTVSPWPARVFAARLTRPYWPESRQPLISYLMLFILLAAGGVCSLVLTNWVPNQLTKAQLKERLDRLVGAVRNLPTSVESAVRVGMRVERLRIRSQLASRWTVGADYAVMAKACEGDIVRLEAAMALLHDLQNIHRDVWANSPGFVPTLMEAALQAGKDAEKKLHGPTVSDADLAAARDSILLANAALAAARTPSEEFRRGLSNRVKEVRTTINALTKKKSAFLAQALARLPQLKNALLPAYEQPDQLPPDVGAIDTAVVKLKIIGDVAEVYDALSPAEAAKMAHVVNRLLGDLASSSLSQIHRAQNRQRELSEDKTIDEIRDAIEKGNFTITVNPPKPITGETALHRVELTDKQLHSSAVRNEITCTWSFSDGWREGGWQVAHYYEAKKPYEIKVSFTMDTGPLTVTPPEKAATTLTPLKVKRSAGFTYAQFIRLALALLIAIVGLLSGAADQIAKLDLVPAMIAIFMIGFSADQIKNIIAK